MELLELAVILAAARIGGYIATRFNQSNVLGQILAGIIIGPSVIGAVHSTEGLEFMSQIGVILLMFLAGLETDTEELFSSGLSSTVIAVGGVVVPFVLGTYTSLFMHASLKEALFLGTILTATSVSITVQTLREINKLNSKEGITIMAAAVIDDVLGILVLTGVSSFITGKGSVFEVIIKILIFTAAILIIGYLLLKYQKIFYNFMSGTRSATFALVFCFLLSFFAEEVEIAAITGAYLAGVLLSNTIYKEKIIKQIESPAFLFFTPVFFTNIGLKADVKTMMTGIVFSITIIIVAIVGKIAGCGLTSKLFGFKWREALAVGIGMIPRGEVALIIVDLGLKKGIVSHKVFATSVLMVLVTTVIPPLFLKGLFSKKEGA
ncbi:MAG: cation:proton antiporter [Thermovenabulum sp.]|uniref:cation:proton antiporter n=1 Tax=Thermovenabulum sp. TaxID=3100335 RepID=UPI003C7E52B6